MIVKIDEKLGLTKEKYRTNVILRSDGTTLYLTKDLALAKVKFEQYHVDRSIYVVDVRQIHAFPTGIHDSRSCGASHRQRSVIISAMDL